MRAIAASAIFLLSTVFVGSISREGQTEKPKGQFLVASRQTGDPFFKESVVLMLPVRQGPLLVGVIINKQTKLSMHDVFPDSPILDKSEEKVYFGGPVDMDVGARCAIFRSKNPPKDAALVFDDVYVTFNAAQILALAENAQQAATMRILIGRAQWDPEQLENEASIGAWHSEPASTDSIFGTLPDALWRILIDKAEPKPVARYLPLPHLKDTSALFE
jgi:putative AlgH/UPF0301 family transcriptional regulator